MKRASFVWFATVGVVLAIGFLGCDGKGSTLSPTSPATSSGLPVNETFVEVFTGWSGGVSGVMDDDGSNAHFGYLPTAEPTEEWSATGLVADNAAMHFNDQRSWGFLLPYYAQINTGHWSVTDSSAKGSFTMMVTREMVVGDTSLQSTWEIVSGTGAYANLRGGGTWQAEALNAASPLVIRATFQGLVRFE
jgi:hypothetical protein